METQDKNSTKNGVKNGEKKVRGNPSKLVPMSKRTKREQSEIAQKGGKASAEKRQEKKTVKELANLLLELPILGENKAKMQMLGIPASELNNRMAMMVGLYKKALTGDSSAVKLYLEITGEAPTKEVNVTAKMTVNKELKEMFACLDEPDEGQ